MYSETLPVWFWILYWLILIITFGTETFCITRRKILSFSILTLLFTLTIPVISLINSIDREQGVNEFELLISQLQQGEIWSIYTIVGYLFILAWYVVFIFNNRKQSFK